MSGKKDKKAINLIGGSRSKSRKKVSAKLKRRSKPGSQSQKGRSRGRRG